MDTKTIGIDLGTTNTCAAVLRGGSVCVIPSAEGGRTTPSVVAFTGDGQHLIGHTAKRQAVSNPAHTVFSIKRFMGQRFCEVLDEIDYMPYEVVSASNGDAHVQLHDRAWSPPEISAILLRQIRREAEAFLGEPVEKAVVTVPAYFNDAQRNATRDAGRIAGLEVVQIINEPTASALAYGFETRSVGRLAVFDFGGGTFDLSILEVRQGVYEVLATNGDTHLGGDDIDVEIICWMLEAFRVQSGLDLARDPMALQRMKEAAERAKCELSSAMSTRLSLPFIAANENGPLHLELELTRALLERLAQPIIDRTATPCLHALDDAGLAPEDLHAVVLVGGATRMPLVVKAVREMFGREPVKGIDPDEAVAMGAALRGAILAGDLADTRLRDVTPLTLGVETEGGLFAPMIKRNSILPIARSEIFSTAADNQHNVRIKVYQGERAVAADNRLLGHFRFAGIAPAQRAEPKIEVKFAIDEDGILCVTARDLDTGIEQTVRIEAQSGLSEDDVDRMRREAKLREDEDRRRREDIALRTKADQVLHTFEHALAQFGETMKGIDRKVLEGTADFLREQLQSGSSAQIQEALDQVKIVLVSFRDDVEGRLDRHKTSGRNGSNLDKTPPVPPVGRSAEADPPPSSLPSSPEQHLPLGRPVRTY